VVLYGCETWSLTLREEHRLLVFCASVLVKSGLEKRDYCRRGSAPLYLQKLALTSPTSGGRSVGIVRSRTKATELVSYLDCQLSALCVLSVDPNRTSFRPQAKGAEVPTQFD
jgi:hypothetical protein